MFLFDACLCRGEDTPDLRGTKWNMNSMHRDDEHQGGDPIENIMALTQ